MRWRTNVQIHRASPAQAAASEVGHRNSSPCTVAATTVLGAHGHLEASAPFEPLDEFRY
jgi:hypothetical protein